jgi:polysaccharide export outer membrane protein
MRIIALFLTLAAAMSFAMGCKLSHVHKGAHLPHHLSPPPPDMPRELSKVVLPTYTIEPPDILVVEAIHIVPRSPYALRTGDILAITVQGTLPDTPVTGAYSVQPGGMVNLGAPYGAAKVAGLTPEQAQEEVRRVMAMHVNDPVVSLSLLEMSGKQQIAGQHMVGPDGTITLGSYGSVPLVGLTLAEAKRAIEAHLSQYLESPEVSVDVFAYNSHVYYIITEGAGFGDGVTRWPVTGNDTVLDAIANINGLTEVSSKRIWIARPAPHGTGVQVLPVDWQAVTAFGDASTNYQLMPGDRVFVAEDGLVAFDTHLAKLLAPFERAMGFSLLGAGTATRFSGKVLAGGGNPGTGGGF